MLPDLVCVDPARVDEFWPHVRPFIESAVTRCGDWTTEVIHQRLISDSQLLWITWDGKVIKAVCVTEFTQIPSGWICNVVCCAGEDGDWSERLRPIEAYAKQWGCHSMRVQGRKGWQRVLKDYELEWISLGKRLD